MLDYNNLFECSCGKFLPFGTKRCPYCGYDYTDIEKSERKILFEKWGFVFCLAFPFIMEFILPQTAYECIGQLAIIFVPPMVLFMINWYQDSKELFKYREIIYKIKENEKK